MKYKLVEIRHYEADRVGEFRKTLTASEVDDYFRDLQKILSTGHVTCKKYRKNNIIVVNLYYNAFTI